MRSLIIVLLLAMVSCRSKEVNFDYQLANPSGITIVNYVPVSEQALTRFLVTINDTLKMKTLNVFVTGDALQKINPNFKKRYYSGDIGKMDLHSFANDTAKAMRLSSFHIETLKDKLFNRNEEWNKMLADGKLFSEPNE